MLGLLARILPPSMPGSNVEEPTQPNAAADSPEAMEPSPEPSTSGMTVEERAEKLKQLRLRMVSLPYHPKGFANDGDFS